MERRIFHKTQHLFLKNKLQYKLDAYYFYR